MEQPRFTPAIFYRDPKRAVAWLERAFGFETTMRIESPDGAGPSHYEMRSNGHGNLMIGGEWADWTRSAMSAGGTNTQSVHVQLDAGLDEHCEHARAAGARIVAEPAVQFFGHRTYRAADLEGHVWTFAMHVRDVTRAEAEAASGLTITASGWS